MRPLLGSQGTCPSDCSGSVPLRSIRLLRTVPNQTVEVQGDARVTVVSLGGQCRLSYCEVARVLASAPVKTLLHEY